MTGNERAKMNIGEANAANTVLEVLFGHRKCDEVGEEAVVHLADRAYRALGAGLDGERARRAWRERGNRGSR